MAIILNIKVEGEDAAQVLVTHDEAGNLMAGLLEHVDATTGEPHPDVKFDVEQVVNNVDGILDLNISRRGKLVVPA